MLLFRQLLDPASSTYTYLVGDRDCRAAILIDPVFEQARRDLALIRELELDLVATVDTHVHADHVTGAWLLRHRTGCRIHVSAASGARGADRLLADGDQVAFGPRRLEVLATPGHTDGCVSLVLDDRSLAFTGDCVLIRGCGRTDFQQGSPERLFRSVRGKLFALPDDCLLYPAHDYRGLTVTSVGEERRHNPRLAEGIGERDFVVYMRHLGLPHPRQMEAAVPANLRCGAPADGAAPPPDPAWAPLTFTFAGIWQIEPAALEDLGDRVQRLDVREPEELGGAAERIPGSLAIPLGELEGRLDALDRDRPIVTICRAGARSAQAAVLLTRAGFAEVANLAGGMLRWKAEGHPLAGGDPLG